MPWEVVRKADRYCVRNIKSGETEGCHDNKKDAVIHQRALYSSEGNKDK